MRSRRVAACGVALATLGAVATAAVPASAARVKTHVVVLQGTTDRTGQTILLSPGTPSVSLDVGLDSTCLTPFGNNKQFGFAASTDNAAVATLDRLSATGVDCSHTAPFTVTAIADGGATIHFDVVSSTGLEGQTAGGSVTISASGFGTSGGGNPPGHARPAAPAVANGYLSDPAVAAKCKAHYDGAHSWRGQLIRAVAHWSKANHLSQAKDDLNQYATDQLWIDHVTGEVNTLCG